MKLLLLTSLCLSVVYGRELVFEDNFDTFNYSKWTLEQGGGGWGNRELEYYTNRTENVRVENGNLVIEVRREDYLNRSFTSARITTGGKFDFKYGLIEARIKLPNMANGLWPAFWMLGSEVPDWPAQGEIDLFEAGSGSSIRSGKVNFEFNTGFHWATPDGKHTGFGFPVYPNVDLSSDFHIFKAEWYEKGFKMSWNDHQYMWLDISNKPTFQKKFFLLLNVAVGGTYPGIQDPNDITAPLPAQMLVDYVRVYQ